MDSVDSDIHVNSLTAACVSETPTLFVPLTCNQKDHPGIAPLMKELHIQFGNQPGEQLRLKLEAYMSVFLRCWTRTVELLLKYLQLPEEHILGDIIRLWARSEFQSLSANLQHCHMLLWLKHRLWNWAVLPMCAQACDACFRKVTSNWFRSSG